MLKSASMTLIESMYGSIEYWMICWGPGFLDVVWFCSSPFPPFSRPSAICLSFSAFLSVASRAFWRRGGSGWGVAKSYDCEKAWSSINHPIYVWKYFLNLPHIWFVCPTEDITHRWQPKISASLIEEHAATVSRVWGHFPSYFIFMRRF